jgi:hypothetical protein
MIVVTALVFLIWFSKDFITMLNIFDVTFFKDVMHNHYFY